MELLGTQREPTGSVLYQDIKNRIEDGTLKLGDKLISSKELQKHFGISYRATLRALGRLETEGYITRRQGSGTYVKSIPGRATTKSKSAKRIQVFTTISKYAWPFVSPLIDALKDELARIPFRHAIHAVTHEEGMALLDTHEADATIWVYPSIALNIKVPQSPVVFVGHDTEVVSPQTTGYDIVTTDSRQGGALAGRYLREIDCRSVIVMGAKDIHLGGDIATMRLCTRMRLEGFQFGWGSVVPDSDTLLTQGYTPGCAAMLAPKLLSRNPLPAGIFATSDDLANGLCHALLGHGIVPGKDIKLIGFDGQPHYFSGDPMLTSVVAPLAELGRAAVRMAVERAENPHGISRRLNLACTLCKGQTA